MKIETSFRATDAKPGVHPAYAKREKIGELLAFDNSRRNRSQRRSTGRIRDWTNALLILSSLTANGNGKTKKSVSGFPFFHSRSYFFDHRNVPLVSPTERHDDVASCKTIHLYFGTDQGYGSDAGLSNSSREDLLEKPVTQGVRSLGATSLYHTSLSNNEMETSIGDENYGLGSLGDIMSCPEDKPWSKECELSRRTNHAPDYPDDLQDSDRHPKLQIGNDDSLAVEGGGTLGDIMSFPESNPNEMSQDLKDTQNQKYHADALNTDPYAGGKIHESEAIDVIHVEHLDSRTNRSSGLVTSAGGTLQSQFGHKMGGHLSPLERIALTANGNLQRIFSSYYDAPVHVHVDFSKKRTSANGASPPQARVNGMPEFAGRAKEVDSNTWDRRVMLIVHSKVFCTATSTVTVRDPTCAILVNSGELGIGQLFRHLDKLPRFELIDAGRIAESGGLWREYELSCDEVSCFITEIFEPDAWSISPSESLTDFQF